MSPDQHRLYLVIPQCLWDGPVPKNVPKVPACAQCNHILKSELDTYLRDLLITDRNSAESPVVQGLRPKYIRSVLRNQSRMDRDYREKGEVIAKMSQSGLYQFGLISQTVNQLTEQIMSMIVRGLHRYYLHTLLSKDTSFTITRLFKQEQCEELRSIIETLHGGYDIIGNGDVFACGFASLPDSIPYISIWELNFCRRIVFSVATNLPLNGFPVHI